MGRRWLELAACFNQSRSSALEAVSYPLITVLKSRISTPVSGKGKPLHKF